MKDREKDLAEILARLEEQANTSPPRYHLYGQRAERPLPYSEGCGLYRKRRTHGICGCRTL